MVNTSLRFFNICVLSFSNKKLHYNRAGQQFFNAPCVTGWHLLCRKEITIRQSAPAILSAIILMILNWLSTKKRKIVSSTKWMQWFNSFPNLKIKIFLWQFSLSSRFGKGSSSQKKKDSEKVAEISYSESMLDCRPRH